MLSQRIKHYEIETEELYQTIAKELNIENLDTGDILRHWASGCEAVHNPTPQVSSRQSRSDSKACHFCVQGTYQLFVLKLCFQFLEASTQLRISFLLSIYFIALFLQFFNL